MSIRIYDSETKQDKRLKIYIKSESSLYITLNGWAYYIDDSTDEQIIEKWEDK